MSRYVVQRRVERAPPSPLLDQGSQVRACAPLAPAPEEESGYLFNTLLFY